MIINEFVQWAAILFLGVLCLGLSRQLGVFITRRQDALAEVGPEIGRPLPKHLVPPEASAEIKRLMVERETDRAVLVVVDQACATCNTLISNLEESPFGALGPLIAIVRNSGIEFQERVRKVADLLLNDPDGHSAREANIVATPFAMIVDGELRLVYRYPTGDLFMVIDAWERSREARSLEEPAEIHEERSLTRA